MTTKNENRDILCKVPQVTAFFWIIKVLCTTVGETASDFLNVNMGFGLTGTSIIMGILLAIMLFLQFRAKKYIPGIYWVTVVLISIFGTLVTDNLTDGIGIPLEASTIVFTILLMLTFVIWYRSEKTLSFHSIFTSKREAFYWLAILFTFALGTASGDLMAEGLGLGYLVTGIIVVAVVVCIAAAWRFGLDSVLSFWIIYILTRPLGASMGDYLSQSTENSGLGLGATVTSLIFLSAILAVIIFLTVTKKDLFAQTVPKQTAPAQKHNALLQVGIVALVCVVLAVGGYFLRQKSLTNAAISGNSSFDTSSFITIEQDVLSLVNSGDLSGAKTKVKDLETAWDNNAARLKAIDNTRWTEIDQSIDAMLKVLRAKNQDAAMCKAALEALLAVLQ